MKIPILRNGDILLTSFQDDLTDRDAIDLQFDLLEMIERFGARAVLLDVSSLETIDSYQLKMIGETAAMTRILGCKVVLSGVRPKVAMTLVDLGDVISGVETVLNIELGLAKLNDGISSEDYVEEKDMNEELNMDGLNETPQDKSAASKRPSDAHTTTSTNMEVTN